MKNKTEKNITVETVPKSNKINIKKKQNLFP